MNKNMFIISFDHSIATIALEGNTTFLYEHLVAENNIALEVQEIDSNVVKCIIYGDAKLLKPNMKVIKTNKYLHINFNENKIGKVVTPIMDVISDDIFNIENASTTKETKKTAKSSTEDISLSVKNIKHNVNDIGSNKTVMHTGIKVIDFFTPITYGSKIGIMGGAGVGKAQPLTSKLYTIDGEITMKDAKPNMKIMGNCGLVTITGVYPQEDKKIYKVHFLDDRIVECCEDHIWTIYNKEHGIRNLTIKEMLVLKCVLHIPLYPSLFINKFDCTEQLALLFGLHFIGLATVQTNDTIVISKLIHQSILTKLKSFFNLIINDTIELQNCQDIIKSLSKLRIKDFLYSNITLRQHLLCAIYNISLTSVCSNRYTATIKSDNIQESVFDLIQCIRSIGGTGEHKNNTIEMILCTKYLTISKITYDRVEHAQCISVDAQNGLYLTDDFIFTHNTTLMLEMIKNINTDNLFKIFCGIGERIREGLDMYKDFVNSGIIDIKQPHKSNSILIYGNMDQPASIRQLAGRTCNAIAKHMIKQNKDIITIIDNIFRYNQASSEISTSLNQFQTEKGYHPNIRSMMSKLQEELISIKDGPSVTSLQAIYVPADDNTDIGALTCQEHQHLCIVLSRELAKQQIYPAVDILSSFSINVNEQTIGLQHMKLHKKAIGILYHYSKLLDLINIIGVDNLSDVDQQVVKHARLIQSYMTQPLSVTKQFIDIESSHVSMEELLLDMSNILDGAYDDFDIYELKFKGTIKNLIKK